MARNVIRVNIELDRIFVHDEGDGWGDAEPYLWTVFFKVDGDTVQVTDALKLSGPGTIHTTPGSHGNLGTSDADEGDTIMISSALGEWQTFLRPIPGPPSLADLVTDFGGTVGVVAVLMEEDNVTDDGANAGHQALNAAVEDAIQEIINTRSISNQDVSEEEIAGFTSQIESKVRDAIQDQQNIFENIWSWLNPDDTIGIKVWTFSHDDLDPSTTIDFSKRWKNEGDWEIFGHLSSSVLCPVNALDDFFARLRSSSAAASARRGDDDLTPPFELDPLRKFRDEEYRQMPGLANWFAMLERHTPRLLYAMYRDRKLRESVQSLMSWIPTVVSDRDQRLPDKQLEHAQRVLESLAAMRSRSARIDAKRALDVLELMRGNTAAEAMSLLNAVQPARHPRVGMDASLRISAKARLQDDDASSETMKRVRSGDEVEE